MNQKEIMRDSARKAIRAMGWPESVFMTDHLYESELTHARHDGLGVKISVWEADEGTRPDAPLMVEVMYEEKALHVLGVPAPEEVPGLLRRYADITESLHDGPRKFRVNLETGEVLTEREVVRLFRDVTTMTPSERLNVYLADVVPALRAPGWDHAQVRLDLAENVGCWEDEIVVWGTGGQRGTAFRLVVYVNSDNKGRGFCRVFWLGDEEERERKLELELRMPDLNGCVCHENLYTLGAPVLPPNEMWERYAYRHDPLVRRLNGREPDAFGE